MADDPEPDFWPDDAMRRDAYLALGHFISAWGAVESVVAEVVRTYAMPDEVAASIVLSHMTTRDQINAARGLLEAKVDADAAKAFIGLLKRAENLAGTRNKLVHANWALLTPPPVMYRLSQSAHRLKIAEVLAGLKGRREHQRARSTHAFTVQEICQATKRAVQLHKELRSALNALQPSASP